MKKLVLAALTLATLGSCATQPTQMVVIVSTDLAVPSEVDGFHVHVTDPDGATMHDATSMLVDSSRRTLVLLHAGGPLQPVRIDAEARSGSSTVVSTSRIAAFTANETITIRIALTRACLGRTCGDGMTCGNDGVCRALPLVPCDLDPSTCSDAGVSDASVDASMPVDGPATDDAGPSCTLASDGHLCGVGATTLPAMLLPGDRVTPAPCSPLPAGVGVTYELRGPSGTLPSGAAWTVVTPGDYELVATASAPAACTVSSPFHVQRFDVTPSAGRPAATVSRQGFAARVGMGFVATKMGPYAVTRAGWRDLRVGATGATLPNQDVTGVGVRRGDALFAATNAQAVVTRVHVDDAFSSITFSNTTLPRSDVTTCVAVGADITGSGNGSAALGTAHGVVWIDDTPSAWSSHSLTVSYTSPIALALGSMENGARGSLWAMEGSNLHDHAIAGGSAVAAGAAMALGITSGRALAVDDRHPSAMRLAVCSLDVGVRIYDLAMITSATLPSPIATVGGMCRDVSVDVDGSFWAATSTGLLRLAPDGSDRARPGATEGAPTSGIAFVELAWTTTTREVWALTDAGDVYVATASIP